MFTEFRPDLYQTLIFTGMALTLVRRQGKADVAAEEKNLEEEFQSRKKTCKGHKRRSGCRETLDTLF
ncbi:YxxF [Bacillus atrophaeus UCMB-5137]|nr:YxxF [Bacillus atrophaeus UCMB-5137]